VGGGSYSGLPLSFSGPSLSWVFLTPDPDPCPYRMIPLIKTPSSPSCSRGHGRLRLPRYHREMASAIPLDRLPSVSMHQPASGRPDIMDGDVTDIVDERRQRVEGSYYLMSQSLEGTGITLRLLSVATRTKSTWRCRT